MGNKYNVIAEAMSNQTDLDPRNQEAIQAALEGAWDKAVFLNTNLIEDYPEDIDILNRLGKAYSELGQVNKAKFWFEKVLENDPYNPIAIKNLERLSTLRGNLIKTKDKTNPLDIAIFIEEPGRTKTIAVRDLAMPTILINLRVGDIVKLNQSKNSVTVISLENRRLGVLDPIWGKEISQAFELGSKFNAFVKSIKVGKDQESSFLSVFVKETKHAKKLIHPVFPIENSNFTPFVREETLSYLKDQEETSENLEDIEKNESEDISLEDEGHKEETKHPQVEAIDDEEDFSPK